jgi:hypothetical protein
MYGATSVSPAAASANVASFQRASSQRQYRARAMVRRGGVVSL